jgi:ABC-type phosphate transport system substrate-binding protein
LALFTALHLAASPATAQYSIIVSKASTQQASRDEARDMFTGDRLMWSDGAKVLVIDQAESETGKGFYEKFIGKPLNQVRMQWTKLLLSGQATAPKKCADDEAIKKAVAGSPNAIGYVATSALDETVKEIVRIE